MDSNTIIIFAALLVGLSKGGLGGPVPVSLVVPLLSQVMPVHQAVGLALPLLIFADIFALRLYWRDWNMRLIRLMLPLAIVGILVGTFVLVSLPDEMLRRVIGLFTLGVIVYKLISDRRPNLSYQPRDWHGYLAGWASGFGSALANTGSPPFTAYMLLQRVSPKVFIGTTTLFFAILNLAKVPGYLRENILDIDQMVGIIWVLPIIPIGTWVGRKIIDRINPRVFEWLMILLLLWASVMLLQG
jgi:hypothetical protein